MDLKNLLLLSLSSEQLLKKQSRLHLGRKCYHITYELNGKLLKLKQIKRVRSHLPNVTSRRRRLPLLHKRQNPPIELTSEAEEPGDLVDTATSDTEHSMPIREVRNNGSQTVGTPTYPKATNTIVPQFFGCGEQTDRISMRTHTTQTKVVSWSEATQTERHGIHRYSQTDRVDKVSMWSQGNADMRSIQSQTDCSSVADCGDEEAKIDQKMLVYMLNEIGEAVVVQNQLSHNNSKALNQLIDMIMLHGVAIEKKERFNAKLRMEPRRRQRRRRQHCSRVCLRRIRPEAKWQRCQSVQTERPPQAVCTDADAQTECSLRKMQRHRSRFKCCGSRSGQRSSSSPSTS